MLSHNRWHNNESLTIGIKKECKMTAVYNGLLFDTELDAIWAAFFDLAGWQWWYNPVSVGNWKPNFKVKFPCKHSECNGSHTLMVAIIPEKDISSWRHHPSLSYSYGVTDNNNKYIADSGALFGIGPFSTKWEMAHGSGGGIEDVTNWVNDANKLWKNAVVLIDTVNAN